MKSSCSCLKFGESHDMCSDSGMGEMLSHLFPGEAVTQDDNVIRNKKSNRPFKFVSSNFLSNLPRSNIIHDATYRPSCNRNTTIPRVALNLRQWYSEFGINMPLKHEIWQVHLCL